MKQIYHVLGIMSGTSLDGVDLAFCEFEKKDRWNFQLIAGETIPYSQAWSEQLRNAPTLSAESLMRLNSEYGTFLGKLASDFCFRHKLKPDFISSHGHTIFHRPNESYTLQIGSGPHIAAATSLPVIFDFRSGDVALGGQGAPLVPIGDRLLFSEMDYCLNLGGIANISFEKNGERIAFDICAANMVLNYLSGKVGKSYDANGEMARSGKVDKNLLSKLNALRYYAKPFPKSLGREDVEADVIPILEESTLSVNDLLATFCKHIAHQVSNVITLRNSSNTLLISGGGALNSYLIDCIKEECKINVVVPSPNIINFKEAIIFAFLGVLRMRNEVNCLKSVTGAERDSCGGLLIA
ncbi:MAG: anhydro-N-acetylmuramic acid kinase [Bacteroidetes bacterium]|nr:anhydro-N-acetylmuramic acid kinase [Bacteroidota bacterium]